MVFSLRNSLRRNVWQRPVQFFSARCRSFRNSPDNQTLAYLLRTATGQRTGVVRHKPTMHSEWRVMSPALNLGADITKHPEGVDAVAQGCSRAARATTASRQPISHRHHQPEQSAISRRRILRVHARCHEARSVIFPLHRVVRQHQKRSRTSNPKSSHTNQYSDFNSDGHPSLPHPGRTDIVHQPVMTAMMSQVIKFVCKPAYPGIVLSLRYKTTLTTQQMVVRHSVNAASFDSQLSLETEESNFGRFN